MATRRTGLPEGDGDKLKVCESPAREVSTVGPTSAVVACVCELSCHWGVSCHLASEGVFRTFGLVGGSTPPGLVAKGSLAHFHFQELVVILWKNAVLTLKCPHVGHRRAGNSPMSRG